MEAEDRLTRLETAFETVLPHLATKADIAMLETNIAKLESKMAWETVAILVALQFTQPRRSAGLVLEVAPLGFRLRGLPHDGSCHVLG